MTRVSLACGRPPQGAPIGCSPPHAPLEGSFHVRPWGSLDTPSKWVVPRYPPRGVLRDCSRPVPGSCRGGRVTPVRGFPPQRGLLTVGRSSPPPFDETNCALDYESPLGFAVILSSRWAEAGLWVDFRGSSFDGPN